MTGTKAYQFQSTYASAGYVRKLFRTAPAFRLMSWIMAPTSFRVDRAVNAITRGRQTLLGLLTGMPIVMLTTRGAKSGRQVTVPVIAVRDGERLVVVASNYGRRHHPAWYFNLNADPRASVSIDGAESQMVARQLTGDERLRLWTLDGLTFPARTALQRHAGDREIPIFSLELVDL